MNVREQGSGFQTGKVLSLSGGHFIHDAYTSFLAPFLPLIIDKFGLSLTLAGSLGLCLRLPSVFNPMIGLLSDRMELKYFLLLTPAVSAAAMSLLGVAGSYTVLALLLITAGLSSSFLHVLGPVITARVAGQRLGQAMGFWMTGGELARSLGPLAAVAVVSWLSFEASYPIMIVGLLTSVLLLTQLRSATSRGPESGGFSLKETWRLLRGTMIPLAVVLLFRSFVAQSLMVFLPAFMVSRGESLWFGGASLAVLEFSGTGGALLAGGLSDRLGRRPVIIGSMVASPVLTLAFVLAPDWALLPLLMALGFSLFAATPVIMALVQDHSGGQRGAANGLYMGLSFGAAAAAIFTIGGLADWLGFKPSFIICALVGLAGCPAALFLPRSEPKSRDAFLGRHRD